MLHCFQVTSFRCWSFFHATGFSFCTLLISDSFLAAFVSYCTLFYCTLILSKILTMSFEYFNCKKQPLTVVPLYEKGVLKNVPKFTRKHPHRNVFSIHLLATAKLFNTALFLNTSSINDDEWMRLAPLRFFFSVMERNISVVMGVWVIWPPVAGSDIRSSDLRPYYKFHQTQCPAS